MSAVAGTSGASRVVPGVPSQSTSRATPSALLPAPDAAGLANVEDGLAVIYKFQSDQGAADIRGVENDVKSKKLANDDQLKQVLEAIQKQREAEADAHGFWADLKSVAGSVAKIASVVAGVAAVACSGGAALPLVVGIAAVTLSAGGAAVQEWKLLGKDSDKIGMGLEIAGAAAGLTGAGIAIFDKAAEAATTAIRAMKVVQVGAQLVGAAATATDATAGVVVAGYVHNVDEAAADQEEGRFKMQERQQQIDAILASLKEEQESERDGLRTTAKAMEGCRQAADIAIAGVRG